MMVKIVLRRTDAAQQPTAYRSQAIWNRHVRRRHRTDFLLLAEGPRSIDHDQGHKAGFEGSGVSSRRGGGCFDGTVRNSVRWAMMMKRRESSHGYRERTSGPAPGW
ncbi:hypothetical protein CN195_34210, partial [Sinorhizobium meliloti]